MLGSVEFTPRQINASSKPDPLDFSDFDFVVEGKISVPQF
jgi:hypothetical protein